MLRSALLALALTLTLTWLPRSTRAEGQRLEPEDSILKRQDLCADMVCGNGTCYIHSFTHAATCNCTGTGYNGRHCEDDPCSRLHCGPGVCVRTTGRYATADCDCAATVFTGPHCDISKCVYHHCANSGECYIDSTGGNPAPLCNCSGTGFTGPACEEDLCTSMDCGQGRCVKSTVNGGVTLSCDCSGTGGTGPHCGQSGDLCDQYHCGVGWCVKTQDSQNIPVASCNCTGTGYSGDHCQLLAGTCSLQCGPGVCVHSADNTESCNCAGTSFTGPNCGVPAGTVTCNLQCGPGVCVHSTDNTESCNCTGTGFTGPNCGDDPCSSLDCGQGTCVKSSVNGDVTLSCDCSGTGRTGPQCSSTGDPCDQHHCGVGWCVKTQDSQNIPVASCDCTDTGYSGDHCQILDAVDSCRGVDCGSGVCVKGEDNTASCDCSGTNFNGVRCNVQNIKNFTEALRLSQLFYYAQRSGKLPADNPIPWRNDSALNDCIAGGWYDAGDHVKFGFPMAGALTLLLWGGDRFRQGYLAADQLDTFYDTVKWGLEYLLNAWDPFKEQLVIQVGDGDVDHQFWGRPEDMTMNRPCVLISPTRPGSDVAAETAAALAAGAVVFQEKGDSHYARELLMMSESLFRFARENRGLFSANPLDNIKSWYYGSTGDSDELCTAAVWLYKATGDDEYLTYAKQFHNSTLPDHQDWDDKRAACQLLLYEATKDPAYQTEVDAFLNSWQPGGTKFYSPCGFAWGNETYWGSARHVSNVAFLALVAADDGLESAKNRKWAAEQINYLLGDNPHDGGCFSYEIGYGAKYPLRPHHRAASCPYPPAPCSEAVNLHTGNPSPHILYGGLVGGPILNDGYNDSRDDYVHNEVALDYNSGFQSAVAGLNQLVSTGAFPQTNNLCPCNAVMTSSVTSAPTSLPVMTAATPVNAATSAGLPLVG